MVCASGLAEIKAKAGLIAKQVAHVVDLIAQRAVILRVGQLWRNAKAKQPNLRPRARHQPSA